MFLGLGLTIHGEASILCTPAYVTGDRTSSITITVSAGATLNGPSNLVDGAFANGGGDSAEFLAFAAANEWVRFDFGGLTYITEAKWYQNTAHSHGSWKWQGSLDASAWTDIGSAFTLGGSTTQTQTQLSANLANYRYYRLLGVSGTTSNSPWLNEIEFKQCTAP